MSLDEIRKKINETDSLLIKLLEERMTMSGLVAKEKIKSGSPVFSQEREKEILENVSKSVKYPDEIRTIMQAVMTMSRELQYGDILKSGKNFTLGELIKSSKEKTVDIKRVAFGGKSGSYAEAAAERMFKGIEKIGYPTFSDACDAVVKGEADAAVLPLENTTAGTVNDVYDLIPKNKLYILKSMSSEINHCLLVKKGTKIEDINTVISHPQALSQCSKIIKERNFKTIECLNTAFASEQVAKGKDNNIAAIGSEISGELYGLDILLKVNNESSNQTRFVAVTKDLIIGDNAKKISIAFKLPHRTGSLSWVLFAMAGLNLNLTKIQSRPIADRPWEYIFYVDFMYDNEEKAIQALFQMEQELPEVKLLGWYGDI